MLLSREDTLGVEMNWPSSSRRSRSGGSDEELTQLQRDDAHRRRRRRQADPAADWRGIHRLVKLGVDIHALAASISVCSLPIVRERRSRHRICHLFGDLIESIRACQDVSCTLRATFSITILRLIGPKPA